jgi:hypothetical protein
MGISEEKRPLRRSSNGWNDRINIYLKEIRMGACGLD